jgi:hypothetical protein
MMTSIQKHKATPYLNPAKERCTANRGIKTVSATVIKEQKRKKTSKKPAEHLE